MDSANQGQSWGPLLPAKKIIKIPIQCKICENYMDDPDRDPRFFCGLGEKIGYDDFKDFNENCEEFEIGKYALVEYLKQLEAK